MSSMLASLSRIFVWVALAVLASTPLVTGINIICTRQSSPYRVSAATNSSTIINILSNSSLRKNNCSIIIGAPQGYLLKFAGQGVKGDCRQKYYKIYDGDSEKSDVICSSCSQLHPASVSSGRFLYLLVVGISNTMTVNLVKPETSCSFRHSLDGNMNIVINGTSGRLTLPTLLSSTWDLDCRWKITVPGGYFIKLTIPVYGGNATLYNKCNRFDGIFDNQFGMLPEIMDQSCPHDDVKLPAPRVIYSTGRHMTVRYDFQSDKLWQHYKLQAPLLATYSAAKQNISGSCIPGRPSVIQVSGSFGAISTNNLYRTKPLNATIDCTWIITVPQGSRVKLALQPMSYTFYSYDVAEVRDGASTGSTLLRKSCMKSLQGWPVYSSGPTMSFRVKTPANMTRTSYFYINYDAVKPEDVAETSTPGKCLASNVHEVNNDIILTDAKGKIEKWRQAGITCTWKLTAPMGKYVQLFFKITSELDCKKGESVIVRLPDNGRVLWKRDCTKDVSPTEELPTESARSVWVQYDGGCTVGAFPRGIWEIHYSYQLTVATKAGIAVAVVLFVAMLVALVLVIRKRMRSGHAQYKGAPLCDVTAKET